MSTKEEKLDKLVEGLKTAFGEELESVILYGSAASNEYHSDHSDLNVLVVVKNSRYHKLGRADQIARWWNKTSNPPPLFFTEEEIRSSADVFPIEFSDMQDAHRILFGRDVLADLRIDPTHLRWEVEHELRGKLLSLRSRYVLVAGDVREATTLLAQSLSSFAVLFRHALRLCGKSAALIKAEIFKAAGQEFHFDPAAFLEVLTVRRGEKKLRREDLDTLFEKYFDAVHKVIERIDAL
ncbi:MAG: nucleotidyltransferase domain-containing protein [Acidobacteriia bacterium]|nr:nucleotidyltransferase domain-containing protein [Terriglobia bacterium]